MTNYSLRGRAEAARRRFEEGHARLYREDGSRYYSEEEHAERVSALRTERNRELREIEEEADRVIAEAEADLRALEGGDPTSLLSDSELDRANAKRAFVAEDVEAMGHESLSRRIEAVMGGGDRASMFAYLAAARRRASSARPASEDERDRLVALGGMIDQLEARLRAGSDAYTRKAKDAPA